MHRLDGLGAQLRLKAFVYITHVRRLLLLSHPDHPEAGIQAPGGTIRPGETPAHAALREAVGEAWLPDLRVEAFLGVCDHPVPEWGQVHRRHFFHLTCPGQPPQRWRTVEVDPSDGSLEMPQFETYWADLAELPRLAWGHDAMLGELRRRLGVA